MNSVRQLSKVHPLRLTQTTADGLIGWIRDDVRGQSLGTLSVDESAAIITGAVQVSH